MRVGGLILKESSPSSKGIACLRFARPKEEPYPRELIRQLKNDWYFFWFSSWNVALKDIPYVDLIDIFVAWDDLAAEIQNGARRDCVVIRGGSENSARHDLLFFPTHQSLLDIDLLYIARFIQAKRYDMAIQCVHHIKKRKPDCRVVFLESLASEPRARESVHRDVFKLGLSENVMIQHVPLNVVNHYLNRSRVSLFTSDDEGMCRAVLQTLLAERRILCYRHTKSQVRMLYDDRFFDYYEEQNEECVGEAAWNLLCDVEHQNPGARSYVLNEKQIQFHDYAGWQARVLEACKPLFDRDRQAFAMCDVVDSRRITERQFWQEFRIPV